jgi:hypothetical protein
MREIAPGVWHWLADHPRIHAPVSSYFVADSATLLDPMVPPDEGLEWFAPEERTPERIVLTNRHHDRESQRFVDAFGLPVLVPDAGLHEFEGKDLEVNGYGIGEEVASGIVCHEVGAICPDDMALQIRSIGALALADGLVHYGGELRFVPDGFMDNPEQTKRGLVESFRGLLDVDFDSLLFAHGEPMIGGAKRALREFVETRS